MSAAKARNFRNGATLFLFVVCMVQGVMNFADSRGIMAKIIYLQNIQSVSVPVPASTPSAAVPISVAPTTAAPSATSPTTATPTTAPPIFTPLLAAHATKTSASKLVVKEEDPAAEGPTSAIRLEEANHQAKIVPSVCPAAIRNAQGIYKDKMKAARFQDTVLLVSLNWGYYDFLQNWEWLANQLDLKWAVVAMDDTLYNELGSDRAVHSKLTMKSEASSFRESTFNEVSCNKFRVVLDIMRECNVNVVFSDVDNVFLSDPFSHELGDMIASKYFDYIYQLNGGGKSGETNGGRAPREGNTGFYYMSKDSPFYHTLIERTLAKCAVASNSDDQTLFWKAFHRLATEVGRKNHTVEHCNTHIKEAALSDSPPIHNGTQSTTLCNMQNKYHPTGHRRGTEGVITLHANFCKGKEAKRLKLMNFRKDGYGWSDDRIYKKPE